MDFKKNGELAVKSVMKKDKINALNDKIAEAHLGGGKNRYKKNIRIKQQRTRQLFDG
jgi:hypothetical protein